MADSVESQLAREIESNLERLTWCILQWLWGVTLPPRRLHRRGLKHYGGDHFRTLLLRLVRVVRFLRELCLLDSEVLLTDHFRLD
jgi:hypothetical protein